MAANVVGMLMGRYQHIQPVDAQAVKIAEHNASVLWPVSTIDQGIESVPGFQIDRICLADIEEMQCDLELARASLAAADTA